MALGQLGVAAGVNLLVQNIAAELGQPLVVAAPVPNSTNYFMLLLDHVGGYSTSSGFDLIS